MKKILMIFTSIFILVTIAFAQNYQHKIDSLQNEKSKAEKAKLIADKNLRENPNDENYQISKDARKKIEGLDKALQQTLKEQKAEKELIKKRELQEKEERMLAEYNKRFLEFEYAGVDKAVKNYIKSELAKDLNWDIKDMKVITDLRRGYYLTVYVYIISTSGSEYITVINDQMGVDGSVVDKIKTRIARAWDWHQNPDKFYLFKKEKEANELAAKKMTEAIANYYLGVTGTEYAFTDHLGDCRKVEMYMYIIPNDTRYYYGSDHSYIDTFEGGYRKTVFWFEHAAPGNHYFFMCDDKNFRYTRYTNDDVYTYNASHKLMADKDKIIRIEGKPERYHLRKAELPRRLMKTFELKDYMQ